MPKELRTCYKCHDAKSRDMFYKSDSMCIPCRKTKNHEAYELRKKEKLEYSILLNDVLGRLEKLELENQVLQEELSNIQRPKYLKKLIDKRISKVLS